MAKNNRTSRLTADEKTLLEEYRKSGLTPEDIKALKLQTDEKYIHVLAYRYWIACAKLHNANELLHGNCRCCIHWNALEQEKCPAAPATTWSVQMRRSMLGMCAGHFRGGKRIVGKVRCVSAACRGTAVVRTTEDKFPIMVPFWVP